MCAFFSESIYKKHLCLEGKQLNLEIYDPCSQVSKSNYLLFYFFPSYLKDEVGIEIPVLKLRFLVNVTIEF